MARVSKHTAGPWSVSETVQTNDRGAKFLTIDAIVNGSGVEGLAAVYEGVFGLDPHEEMEANARLIASAPAMLEMLQTIYNAVDWSSHAWDNDEGQKHKSELESLIKTIEG